MTAHFLRASTVSTTILKMLSFFLVAAFAAKGTLPSAASIFPLVFTYMEHLRKPKLTDRVPSNPRLAR